MAISELADWWDKQRRDSDKVLEEWVQENPQWWAVGIATATATSMELGNGMVDALRLGEGTAQGTVGGVATDAMRMLVIVGPLARAGGALGRLAQTQMVKLAVTTKGVTGPCTFTAINNAASIAAGRGRNFFYTVREAAKALGKPLKDIPIEGSRYKIAAWIDDLIPFLNKQGIRARSLGVPKTIEDVVEAAGTENGAVIFAIEWTDMAGKIRRHSLIAVRTLSGVRFCDYGGRYFANLNELATRGGAWAKTGAYRIASQGIKGRAVLVEGMEFIATLERYGKMIFEGGMVLLEGVTAIETPDQGIDLALPVVAAAAIERSANEPEVIKRSYEVFKARKEGKKVIELDPIVIKGRRNGPPPVKLLTGVQYRLNALGFAAGPIDGIYGPKTKAATIAFQKAYTLVPDGIPGPLTQGRLVEIAGF